MKNTLYSSLASTSKRGRSARTANGAKSNASSLSKVLDFFAQGGALRGKGPDVVLPLFKDAFFENKELALKCLFYFRDIRGGQGERNLFRVCYNWLAENYPDVARKNLDNIPFYGRWDDLYCLFDTPLEFDALECIKEQVYKDLRVLGY